MTIEDPSIDYAPSHSNNDFRRLFLSVTEHAIVLLDRNGRITGWNPGAERLFGWTAEEALGASGALIFTEEDQKAGAPHEEIETAAAEGHADDTRWHVKKGGERFWASAATDAIYGEAGSLQGFAKIVRDRTDIKRYEEELERSNRNLDAFASHIAHEVRSPLTGVRLVLNSLLRRHEDTLTPADREQLQVAQETIDDIDRLTSNLLSYARLSRNPQVERERTESREVLQEVFDALKAKIEEQGAEVKVDTLPPVYANPTLLRHLFQNLVGNALTYNEAEVPRIRIAAEEEKDAWTFRVEDNGVGIPKEHQGEIFDLFKRGESGEMTGIGVGLAFCQRIVESHGGRIWVESEPGTGSTFYFTLPKSEASPP